MKLPFAKHKAKYKLLNTNYFKKLISLALVLLVLGGFSLKYFTQSAGAAWFDENFAYRTAITFTNSGSAVTYQKVKFDIDTATLISAGKMQSDCGDSRFTDANGKVLKYYLDSTGGACDTNSTDYYVLMPSIVAGENILYHYYGNLSAVNGTEATQFSESTFSQTPSVGSEEKAPQPVAYWSFDDPSAGSGQVVLDSTASKNNGTLGSSSSSDSSDPTWQSEDQCIKGKCLYYDGSNDGIGITGTESNFDFERTDSFSGSMWIKPQITRSGGEAVKYLISKLDSNSPYSGWEFGTVWNTGSAQSKTVLVVNMSNNFPSNAMTVIGSTDLQNNTWYHVSFTYDGSSSTSGVKFYVNGKLETNTSIRNSLSGSILNNISPRIGNRNNTEAYWKGYIDEVKVYKYTRTAAQILADYNTARSALGGNVLGASTQKFLSEGLVGYWKMDESSGNLTDSSGNSNTGTVSGTSVVGGVFGNGRSFTGSSYADITMNQTFQQTTICTWLKTSTTTGYIYTQNNVGNTANLGFLVTAAGKLSLGIWNGTTIPEATSTTTITNGTWIHGCAVRDGGKFKIYINGSLESSITNGNTNDIGTLASIGRNRVTNDTYYNGQLDDMRIYNRALSPAEVSTLYNFAPGPVGYWNLDEKSGTTASDISGNGNTGTWNGSGNHFVSGKVGGAGNFNGSSDYITSADATNLNSSSVTVEAWVKFTVIDGVYRTIAGKWQPGVKEQYLIQIDSDNKIGWWTGNSSSGAGGRLASSTTPVSGRWYHIAATITGTTKSIYLNGVLDNSTTSGNALSGTSDIDFGIGSKKSGGGSYYEFFNGQIDDVKVYNYARSAKQISEDMMGGHPAVAGARSGSMVGYWKMDEGNGTAAKDSSGNGNNGTLTNMATAPSTGTSGWSNFGKFNKALNFDGSNDTVIIQNNTSLNMSSGMSFSTWVYPTTIPGSSSYAFIGKKSDGSAHQYALYVSDSACSGVTRFAFSIWIGTVNKALCATNTTLVANTWYHVVGAYDGTTIKIYINGKLDNSIAQTGTIDTGTGTFKIGTNISDLYWSGRIDEVKIYGSALTADEVKTDYNRGASLQFGSTGTSATGVNDTSSERSYCPPGDSTANCSPVGEWNFEDPSTGSGQAADTSVNGLTGTATSTSFVPGKVGKGLQFTGSDSYVNLGTSALLNIAGTKTVQAWVKVDSSDTTNTYRRIFSKREGLGSSETTGYELVINPSTCVVSFFHVAINPTATATATNCRGNWIHIAAVYTGTQGIVYINGVPGTASTFSTASSNSSPALIGTCGSEYTNGVSGCDFKGQIDQVKVYNYARNSAQIAWDYNRGAPVAWYKMDECQGSVVHDSSPNRLDGTVTIGASGSQTAIGTCQTSGTAWGNGAVGKINSSLNFDGTNDYVSVPNTNSLNNTGPITISAWVKPTNYSTYRGITSKGSGNCTANCLFDIYLTPTNGFLRFIRANGSTYYEVTSSVGVPQGQWSHITVVDTGSSYVMYLNGKQLPTSVTFGSYLTPTTNSVDMRIGLRADSATVMLGGLDDLRMYNYALTSTQIKDVYNGGSVRFGPLTGTP